MSTHFSVFDLLETVDRLQTRREIGKVDFVKLLSDQLCQLSITLGRKQALREGFFATQVLTY